MSTRGTENGQADVPRALVELAPTALPRDREDRFAGEGFAVSMDVFADPDRRKIRRVYERCEGLYQAWLEERQDGVWPEVEDRLAEFRDPTFVEEVKTLGRATLADSPEPEARKVLHDVRSGGLTGLVAQAEMAATTDALELVQEAVLLARDHAKMMRQAVVDVDPAGRREDEQEKRHTMEDVARKWSRVRYRVAGASAEVQVDCRYEGGLASRCLEAAAVDRILYNLINNATRFATDGRVELHIFAVGDDIRFVVANAVDEEHLGWLLERTEGDLGQLFRGGITRGGHGIGLTSCAGLVAAAYGQYGPREAVENGYLGARVLDGVFHAWFHWPAWN